MFQLSLRDLLWLTAVAALMVGWSIDHWRMDAYLRPYLNWNASGRIGPVPIHDERLREEVRLLKTQVEQLEAERTKLKKALEEKEPSP